MESQRPDPDLGVQLQLEEAFSHRRAVMVELLLSSLSRCDQDRAGDRFLETPPTSRQRQAAHCLGRCGHPSKPTGAWIPEKFEGQNLGGTSPGLCPGTQPVEYLWGYWKQHELPNLCARDLWQLSGWAAHALRRIRRKRSRLICAFWQQAELW
jgi:hypothetical protein